MLKYHVLSAYSCAELEECVQDHLNHGWKLQGGVSICRHEENSDYNHTFAQAVTREVPSPQQEQP